MLFSSLLRTTIAIIVFPWNVLKAFLAHERAINKLSSVVVQRVDYLDKQGFWVPAIIKATRVRKHKPYFDISLDDGRKLKNIPMDRLRTNGP